MVAPSKRVNLKWGPSFCTLTKTTTATNTSFLEVLSV